MSKALMPWLFPALVLVGIMAASISTLVGYLAFLFVAAVLICLRLRSLKRNPPNPELTHKAFWRF